MFKVTAATVPPLVTTTQEAKQIEDQLATGMGDDLIDEYIAQVRKERRRHINQQALRQATGGERSEAMMRRRPISSTFAEAYAAGEPGRCVATLVGDLADPGRRLPEAAARPGGRRPSCSNPSRAAPCAAASR